MNVLILENLTSRVDVDILYSQQWRLVRNDSLGSSRTKLQLKGQRAVAAQPETLHVSPLPGRICAFGKNCDLASRLYEITALLR
jgi:hypothetical protein